MRLPPTAYRALLGALVLTGLALPAPAAAAVPLRVEAPPGGESLVPRIAAGVALGERRFGPACAGGVRATWSAFEVSYPNAPGARAWARAFREECRIDFNLSVWTDAEWRAGVYDWPWLCTLVVHEYGHLAGLGHADDEHDVMHATIERVIPECRAAPAAAGAVTAARPARARGATSRKRHATERLRSLRGLRPARR